LAEEDSCDIKSLHTAGEGKSYIFSKTAPFFKAFA
jgi:hypothetical protein